MKLAALVSPLLLAGSALATYRAGYDNTYDNASGSMDSVACSDGQAGLASRYPTFGSAPTFPNIGGTQFVAGWNSPNCGTCWQLTYDGTSILVLAIDHADDGFNLSQEALDTLTDGQAVQLGTVQVDAEQVDSSLCGL
ncbi:SnodProt1 [Phellopilus nigrolimitatus]|nr:SnodProt1 [Phellopilus nigrolimitatus]